MTGKIQCADAVKAFELGANDFCVKTKNVKHVVKIIIEFE